VNVKELAPHVRPAGRLVNARSLSAGWRVELVEPRIAIGLQHAPEPLQVRLLMRSLAVGAVFVERPRWRGLAPRPAVAHVDPQPTLFSAPAARIEHRHRRVVAVQALTG